VAFLSFSTHGSARHPRAERVAEAARILAARAPDLVADGEIQLDAALVPGVAAKKAPASPLRGRANVLVFPDLGSADVGSRVLATLGGARVLGPFLQGLERPVAVLGQAPADDVIDALALVATLCVGSSPEGNR
jgi:phosphotransacetylase